MKPATRIVKALSFCLLLAFAVAACTPAPRKNDSYVSPVSGSVTRVESGRESCVASCNGDFDRCSDSYAATATVGRSGDLGSSLGAAADCRASLRSCLAACKGR